MKKYQGPLLIDNVNMHLYIYMGLEYIGIYDTMKRADRMKYLRLGCQIFDKKDKSFYDYRDFQKDRIQKIRFAEVIFRVLLIGIAFFVPKSTQGIISFLETIANLKAPS